MSQAPENHELARRMAVLEERINTQQATPETSLERLRADIRRMKISLMIWIAVVGGYIFAAIAAFNL